MRSKRLRNMAAALSFLYEAAVREELAEGKLRVLPLEDFPLRRFLLFMAAQEFVCRPLPGDF